MTNTKLGGVNNDCKVRTSTRTKNGYIVELSPAGTQFLFSLGNILQRLHLS